MITRNYNKAYPLNELLDDGKQKQYSADCSELAFLLGGIGTGNYSVGARGEMRDWEIFGSPGKGNFMPNTFFAVRYEDEEGKIEARVLESRLRPPFGKSHGFVDFEVAGLPRFDNSIADSRYPFYNVHLIDDAVPLNVTLECFTPFIPLNTNDSSIPTGIMRYRIKNNSSGRMKISVVGSLANTTTLKSYSRTTWKRYFTAGKVVNEYKDDGTIRGLFFHPEDLSQDSLYYGTMALTTRAKDISYKRSWLCGGWWDGLQDMWDDFCTDGRMEPESVYTQLDVKPEHFQGDQVGSLAIHAELEPNEEGIFEFQISWCFPNRVNSWSRELYDNVVRPENEKKENNDCNCSSGCNTDCSDLKDEEYPTVKQYYATLYKDAWAAAAYTAGNMLRLERDSRTFAETFFSSTIPSYVLEAVSHTITVIRSTTCIRLYDGTFLAWEGCFNDEGCCEGSCTHVWNYAHSIAFLFPELERSMRTVEYCVETNTDGKMNFRSYRLWGMDGHDHVPAADGQMGCLVRLYREWKFSGDDEFLRKMWTNAKKTIEFAINHWDKDGDGVLDSGLFNTYDISFEGPSSMINSVFYAALKACSEMADYLGDFEASKKYLSIFKTGCEKMDGLLWGGEYYIQKIDDVNKYRYQYGEGCLSDQIFGQTLAHVTGLGYILPQEHVKQAIKAVFDYNFLPNGLHHHNTQRTYMLNDEPGLLLCSWPKGKRPRLPFPYSDEVWTGIEYQVATNLIYEGWISEGLTLVKALRDRHDGIRRNPFNEVECGHHYARSLASFGVLIGLCGFKYDLTQKIISFEPKINTDNFKCFFITGKMWGVYSRIKLEDGTFDEKIEVLYGEEDCVNLVKA